MGTVYKETYTKPCPDNAESFKRKGQRYVRWVDGRGKKKTAKLTTSANGDKRILMESNTYTAKYRDGNGVIQKVSTGCRSLDAAKSVLADLEKRADKVRSGITTAAEDSVLDHQTTTLKEHLTDYDVYLSDKRGKGGKPRVSKSHRHDVRTRLEVVANDKGFKLLRDLNRQAFEKWADERAKTGQLSARTLNAYAAAWTAFGNWCVETGRLVANPFARLRKYDEKADRRHQRRALTEDELVRLFRAAQFRPLAEYGRRTVKLPPNKREGRRTWTKAPLTQANFDDALLRARKLLADRPELIASLGQEGRERALIYKTLTLTGLRKGELGSITIGQLDLRPDAGRTAYLQLHAIDAKSGSAADIPIRRDLADELHTWLSDRLIRQQNAARNSGEPIPAALSRNEKLFNVPAGLLRIFDRDAQAAGIPKRDDRDRVVDIHSLRHTFGTLLSRGGVAPRTAQAAMRHSKLDLTMNVYTDPRLLDVAGAMDVLPHLPLNDESYNSHQKATGTEDASRLPDQLKSLLVPMLVPSSGNVRTDRANHDMPINSRSSSDTAVSDVPDRVWQLLAVHEKMEPDGIEPTTSCLQSRRSPS